MKSKKRGIALILAVIMIISMIPITAFGSNDTVVYNVTRPRVGIMNKINSENDLFRRTYLRNNSSHFNLVYKFTRTGANNVKGASSDLSYGTSMMHYENGDFWKAYYQWNYQKRVPYVYGGKTYYLNGPTAGNEGIAELFSKGEILFDFSANLTADKHWNLKRHTNKILDRAYASLVHTDERGSYSFLSMANSNDAPDESPQNFRKTGRISYGNHLGLELYFTGLGCKCGSSKVANVSIGLIDDVNPKINNIYASMEPGGVKEPNGFKSGETGYINVQFSENIRFANDQIPSEPIMLNFIIKGANNNVQINTNEVQGKLVELSGNKMVFKFEVPEKIGGDFTNVYISGISQNQSWVNNLGGENKFPLILLGKDGSRINLTGNLGLITELTRTSSLITDMSGNPVNWQGSTKNLTEPCFLDNVPPAVSTVEIQGPRISADSHQTSQADDWPRDIDRSTVFAGIGDTLTYSVKFSEAINVPGGIENVRAYLNGENGSNKIELKGKSLDTIGDGVNGIKVSKITFEPIKITKDMIPDGTRKPLLINELKFPTGTIDLRRNLMAASITNIPAPAQQQYLDTQLPVAETNITKVSGKYTPIFYEGSDKDKEFFFPITVKDIDNIGSGAYASGVNGVVGSLAWLDESSMQSYPFDYYISGSSEKPDDSQYTSGMSSYDKDSLNSMAFNQVVSGNYIHIKLRDDIKYNINNSRLVIIPVDYAQNKGYSSFDLNFSADYVEPEMSKSGEKYSFDIDSEKGTIGVIVSVKDPSGIIPTDVEYQWVSKGGAPVEGNWQAFNGIPEDGYTDTSISIKIEKGGLVAEVNHEYDLLIRAIDKKGNMSEEPYRISCIYDLEKANPNIEISTGINIPAKDIVIGMELSPYSGGDTSLQGLDTTSIFMIKNPKAVEGNEYFITILSSKDRAYDQSSYVTNDVFHDKSDNWDVWYRAKVTEVDNKYMFSDSEKLEIGDEDRRTLHSIINHESVYNQVYYGDVEVIFITAYGDAPEMYRIWQNAGYITAPINIELVNNRIGTQSSFYLEDVDGVYYAETGSFDPNSFYYTGEFTDVTTSGSIQVVDVQLPFTKIEGNINVQEYNFMLAPEKSYVTNIGVKFGKGIKYDGTEGLMWNEDDYVPGGTPKYLKNLDGARIPFEIYNPEVPNWGTMEMDFESDDTYVALYYTEHGVHPVDGGFLQKDQNNLYFSDGGRYDNISELTPLVKIKPLETGELQEFVIPYGITNKIGFYALEVSVKRLNSDRVQRFYFTDMYADGSMNDDNGISFFDIGIYDAVSGNYEFSTSVESESHKALLGTASAQTGYEYKRSMYLDLGRLNPVETITPTYNVYPLAYYKNNDDGSRKIETMYPDSSMGMLKIWNAASTADGKAPDYVQWIDSSSIDINVLNSQSELNEESYRDEEGNAMLPLISDGLNTICYQLILSNGEESQVKQLSITTSSHAPEFDLKLDSDGTSGFVPSVMAFAENVVALNGAKKFNAFYQEYKWEENMEPVNVRENMEYYFFVEDYAGNITFKKQDINWIDREAPYIYTEDNTNGTVDNEFNIKVTMNDNNDLTDGKLYITFDKDYSTLLNPKETDLDPNSELEDINEFLSLEVPLADGGIGEWCVSNLEENHGGIYRTNAVLSNDNRTKTIEIWGVFKYDDEELSDEVVNRRFTFRGTDQAGNLSEAYETDYYEDEEGIWQEYIDMDKPLNGTYIDINSKNIMPEFTGASLTSEDKVKLGFTAQVFFTAPINGNPLFGKDIDSAPIYNDGVCDITYRDLFGADYTETVEIIAFGSFDTKVKISETVPTQNDVTVAFEIPEGSDVRITGLKGDITSGTIDGNIAENEKTATITMTDNGSILLSMENNIGEKKNRTIIVSNIDRIIESVTPYIYYFAGEPAPGDTITEGSVTVGVYCDELLTGINGPLTYTFTNGAKAGDTHTFYYEDMAKNQGSITITLNYDVEVALEDETPPDYSIVLYSKLDYMNQQYESFTQSVSLENAIGSLPKAQGYMLVFNIFDESKVKMIVKERDDITPSYGDESDVINGVIVNDKSIIVNENSEFTVYLVDEEGNTTVLPTMTFNNIDNTIPTATVEYAASTFYSTIGYLIPSENIILTNITGVEKALDGTYGGKYYHEYKDNEEFIFYYKDEVGNTGSTLGKVDWLDASPPDVISLKWTPTKVDQSLENRIYLPPTELTNMDVIAQIEFNKTVKDVKAYNKGTNDLADSSKVKITFVQNGAIVTYSENADIELYIESYNGKSARFSMGKVECIDKELFNITDSAKVSTNKQNVEYTFSSNKDVHMAEDIQSGSIGFKKVFKYTFTANGTYDMHFTDKAGNTVVYKVIVNQLDKEVMNVKFNTVSSDTGAVEDASKLNMTGKDKFYVKLSKDGTVNYEGKTLTAAANTWVEFEFAPIKDKAFYMIETVDSSVGSKVFSYLNVEIPDVIPPTIIFATPTISFREGSKASDINGKINVGVTASDNKDGVVTTSIVSVTTVNNVSVSITDDMDVGRYRLEYEAKDAAGNSTVAYRTLRIYSKDSINAMINGIAAEPESTLVLKTNDIVLNVENLPTDGINTEPCRVYYKVGLMTVGQMKIRASVVETDHFTLPGTGFYTIYIQAQDRKDYITYVYIEK